MVEVIFVLEVSSLGEIYDLLLEVTSMVALGTNGKLIIQPQIKDY
jgi:hypothetical protein